MLRYAIELLRRLTRRTPPPDDDRWTRVRQPIRRGPHSGSVAVALEEPREPRITRLFGRRP